jgi:hypothetical protein
LADFSKPRAVWKGRLEGDRFHGQWIDRESGRKRAFDLKLIATYDAYGDPDFTLKDQPYDYLKVQGHAVPVGEVIGDKTLAYQMYADPRSVLKFPRLVRHPNSEVLERTNRCLEMEHWVKTLEALSCNNIYRNNHVATATPLGNFDKIRVEMTHLSATMMSFVESGSTYCGKTYPYTYQRSYVLKLVEKPDWNPLIYGACPPAMMQTSLP